MDKKLEQIKTIFEKEFNQIESYIWDNENIQAIEFTGLVSFFIQDNDILVSFYSSIGPSISAWIIVMLIKNGVNINNLFITDSMYPYFKKDKYIDTFFGKEADEQYKQVIFEEKMNDILLMVTNAYGPKQ